MSRPAMRIPSLSGIAARAVVLTSGALVALVLMLIVGVIVVESSTRHHVLPANEALRWRADGQFGIYRHSASVGEEMSQSLDRKPLAPAAISGEYFSFVDEGLKRRVESRHPQARVQRISNVNDREVWYFQRRGSFGVYVIVNSKTRLPIGYVGRNGFQEPVPTDEESFDLKDATQVARNFLTAWDYRVMHLDWSGASLNFTADQEVLLQDGNRRVYVVDLKSRVVSIAHDGEPVRAVAMVKLAGQTVMRLALLFNDRVEEIPLDSKSGGRAVVQLPQAVREWPSFEWIPRKVGLNEEQIYVRAVGNGYEIVWADGAGQVLKSKSLNVENRNRNERVDGKLVAVPPGAAWAMSTLQSPAFLLLAYGSLWDGTSAIGRGFDPHLALPALQGVTVSELRWNTVAATWLPLLVTLFVGLLWAGAGRRLLVAQGVAASERRFWIGWLVVFGLPGYLALRVSRRWPVLVSCSQCSQRTPCSAPACLRCGAERVVGRTPRPSEMEHAKGKDGRDIHPTRARDVGLFPAFSFSGLIERVEQSLFDVAAQFGSGMAVLVVKELRTVAGVAVLAMAAYLLLVGDALNVPVLNAFGSGLPYRESPFVVRDAGFMLTLVGAIFAVVLGFWQTASDGWNGAWQFLLHRPVSRKSVLLSKLLTGWSVLLVLSAWPIVVLAWWAQQPGSYAAPFEWWMTESFWRRWWMVPVLYLAAFACGLRPARWWGTRLMPLVAMGGVVIAREQLVSRLWPMWQEVVLASGLMAVLVVAILTVGRERDYA